MSCNKASDQYKNAGETRRVNVPRAYPNCRKGCGTGGGQHERLLLKFSMTNCVSRYQERIAHYVKGEEICLVRTHTLP